MVLESVAGICVAWAIGCGGALAATPPTLVKLHSFHHGGNPVGLVADKAGVLYGVTEYGDNTACYAGEGCGIIYQLTPPIAGDHAWAFKKLYQFKGKADGAYPNGQLLLGADGDLYGTANLYSDNNYTGNTVFRLIPPQSVDASWTFETLSSAATHVADSLGAVLAQDPSGDIYGTDGSSASVFMLTPPATSGLRWSRTSIATVAGAPVGGVVADARGNLYGATYSGGAGYGTVYRLARPTQAGAPWTYHLLHAFTGGDDGGYPNGAVTVNPAGSIVYGTTFGNGESCAAPINCGTVFKLTHTSPSWVPQTIHVFDGSDGVEPWGQLLVTGPDKPIYGTTGFGPFPPCGTVFQLSPPTTAGGTWTEQFYTFELSGGVCNPGGNVLLDATGHGVYGTASTAVFDVVFHRTDADRP